MYRIFMMGQLGGILMFKDNLKIICDFKRKQEKIEMLKEEIANIKEQIAQCAICKAANVDVPYDINSLIVTVQEKQTEIDALKGGDIND